MTREEAISLLRRYRRDWIQPPTKGLFGWKLNYEFMRSVYERMLILELIQRIKHSDRGPMSVMRDFYYKMDDILCESEHPKTWAFASIMESCTADILRYMEGELIREKRRKRRDAKN